MWAVCGAPREQSALIQQQDSLSMVTDSTVLAGKSIEVNYSLEYEPVKEKISKVKTALCIKRDVICFQPQIPTDTSAGISSSNRIAKLIGCDPIRFYCEIFKVNINLLVRHDGVNWCVAV